MANNPTYWCKPLHILAIHKFMNTFYASIRGNRDGHLGDYLNWSTIDLFDKISILANKGAAYVERPQD